MSLKRTLSIGNKSKDQYLHWKLCPQKHTFLGTIYLCWDGGVVIKGWFCHINTLLFLPWVSEKLESRTFRANSLRLLSFILFFFSLCSYSSLKTLCWLLVLMTQENTTGMVDQTFQQQQNHYTFWSTKSNKILIC